jgi:hypothetical protein
MMLALHRTTGQCYADWAKIEPASVDVTNQARHLAQALLPIRHQSIPPFPLRADLHFDALSRGAVRRSQGLADYLGRTDQPD